MECSPTRKILCGSEECDICFNRSFASHPKAEFWSESNELKPIKVSKCSNKKYNFDCIDCGHQIEMSLNNVVNGQWCAYCNSDKLCELDDCMFCFHKSFASHEMAASWSSRNTFKARNIVKLSEKKALFNCLKCNHDFETQLCIIKNDTHCPYCSNQRLCTNDTCTVCIAKSCASHEMAKKWSDKNIFKAREVFLQSNKKFKFNCLTCKHEYQTTPNHYYNRGSSCSFCDNKQLCDSDSCKLCLNKSFASHEKVKCWSSKNTINPRMVFKGSNSKYIFNCDECTNEINIALYNVLAGYWCPLCKNKTEGKLLKYLTSIYSECKTQIRFDWCRYSKTNNIMPFDFELNIQEHKVLIELDGRQHFHQVSNWDSPLIVQAKDVEKINKAINAGYSIIHIYQEEVWKDSYDWKIVLKHNIDLLLLEEKPKIVFISKEDIYKSHIEKLKKDSIYSVIHP